ncbi:MFS transporter [Streptomyces sp. NPDC006602]|uniref:MFS transporter n=1 Tax=Streptomyces sp. NPDC006602 TaxID=3364751 RepID=UPI0036990761
MLGRLADRLGRRRVLVVSLLLFTLANFATALAPNYPLLVVARVVAGAAAAGTGPTIYALSSATAPANRRATHLALVGSGLLSALWAGAPLGDVLGHHLGWQYVFAVLALATALLALAKWRVAGGSRPARQYGGGHRPTARDRETTGRSGTRRHHNAVGAGRVPPVHLPRRGREQRLHRLRPAQHVLLELRLEDLPGQQRGTRRSGT